MFLAVACIVAIVLAGTALVLSLSSNRDRAVSAQTLAEQIQKERVRNIRATCEMQNARHDKTIVQLDELIRDAPPGRRERAVQNRAGTALLIDALVPKRDCDRVVKQQAVATPEP
jgi:hypothetical protein